MTGGPPSSHVAPLRITVAPSFLRIVWIRIRSHCSRLPRSSRRFAFQLAARRNRSCLATRESNSNSLAVAAMLAVKEASRVQGPMSLPFLSAGEPLPSRRAPRHARQQFANSRTAYQIFVFRAEIESIDASQPLSRASP